MEKTFWIGILLGGFVGFIASVVANMATPSFANYFTRSKVGWIERTKKKAIKQFQVIQRFHSGAEDKYMYFVAQWGYILFYSIFAAAMTVFLVQQSSVTNFAGPAALFGISLAGWTHKKLYLWYWRINRFEEYKNSLIAKWGDLELKQAQPRSEPVGAD